MIKAVIFDMFETLVSLFEGKTYFGEHIAADVGADPVAFRKEWHSIEDARSIGTYTIEEGLEVVLRRLGIYSEEKVELPKTPENKDILDSIHDIYYINEDEYKLNVQMVQSGEQICWIDVSRMDKDHLITCNINVAHELFQNFGTPNSSTIALLKTLAIARVAAALSPEKSASDMLNYFNQFISQTKA